MKLKKILICLLLILSGCSKPQPIEDNESKEPFKITLFYTKTCHYCKDEKEVLIPMIEEEFKDQVSVELIDIDDEGATELYDSYIGLFNPTTKEWEIEGSLADVDEETASYNRYCPLMIVGNYYAFMGYSNGLKKAYIQDIHLALQNKPLGIGDVSKGRWLFK